MIWKSEIWSLPTDSWFFATIGGYVLTGSLFSFAILFSGALIQFVGVSQLILKLGMWTMIVSLILGYAGDIYLYWRQDQCTSFQVEDSVKMYDWILELKKIASEAME